MIECSLSPLSHHAASLPSGLSLFAALLCPTPSPPARRRAPLGVTSVARFFAVSLRECSCCVCTSRGPRDVSLFLFFFFFLAQEVEEGGENEQGGRVYAFSPSLLIINVSQVHKIASCSFHSILPSSSLSLRGSPSSLPICLLPTPPSHCGLPLHLNLSPNTLLLPSPR